jgi:hypothetical protein
MNAAKPEISQDDILAKMDALLKKHRINADQAPVVEDDFPILSEIVEVKETAKPVAPPAHEDVLIDFDVDAMDEDFPVLEIPASDAVETSADIQTPEEIVLFSAPDQLLPEPEPEPQPEFEPALEPESEMIVEEASREPELVIQYQGPSDIPAPAQEAVVPVDLAKFEQAVTEHVLASVDAALETLLERFSTRLEAMVRETVTQEMNRQLTALLQQDEGGSPE